MHLLSSSPISAPQFASLSLLTSKGMAQPLMTISTITYVSKETAREAVCELHEHVLSLINSTKTNDFTSEILREDYEQLSSSNNNNDDNNNNSTNMQIYRLHNVGNGLALHYRLLRGTDYSKLEVLLLASKGTTATPGNNNSLDPTAGVEGVILCIGVSGNTNLYGTILPISYTLEQRISDCTGYLQHLTDVQTAKSILSTFLVTEDDVKITNDMAAAPKQLLLPEETDERGMKGVLLSPMGMITPFADFGRKANNLATRKASVRGNMAGSDESGEPPPDIDITFPLTLELNSADMARTITERLTVLSVGEIDTYMKKYDMTGQERRTNLDLHGGTTKSRFRRRKGDTREADFDSFEYKGPIKESVKRATTTTTPNKVIPALPPATESTLPSKKLQLRSSNKDTRKGLIAGRRGSAGSRNNESVETNGYSNNNNRTNVNNKFDPFFQSRNSNNNNHRQQQQLLDDDGTQDSRSQSGHPADTSSVQSSSARVAISLALNEDLTCIYTKSQLSSCGIEGVVQVQAKCSSRPSNIPFVLLVRDPSGHIDGMHENRKFAEMSSSKSRERYPELRFNVVVPQQDTFFPLLKYTCSANLRPVPLRVQTKVKSDGGHCRVALQISSNPNNEANLSDLTIVMGVPEKVVGNSLQTQPAGGVWDDSKASVIWCVSELGPGEKFQLQARFATREDDIPADDLSFPVLVRCHCLQVQLSDIQFEVRENTSIFPAETTVKVARRYRLSHREKNN